MHTVSACLETYIIIIIYMPVGVHTNIYWHISTQVTCLFKDSYEPTNFHMDACV